MKLKYRIEDKFDKFIRRCQRFIKGYSNYDLWDIDYWFIDIMRHMLTEFRDKTCSYPKDNECRSIEDWRYILSEMIECLDGMDIDKRTDECIIYDKKNKTYKYDIEQTKLVEKKGVEDKERFFELFSKYFYDLWW